MLKLNLGAGYSHIQGFKSVDFRKETKPDYLADLEKNNCLKVIKTDSVDEVFASHVLEHIKNIEGLMKEVYRVSKHEAKVTVIVPYWSHHTAVEDFTHIRYFTEKSMMYLSGGLVGSDGKPVKLPYDFRQTGAILYPEKGYEGLSAEKLQQQANKYLNVIRQITFILKVNKNDMAKKKGGKKGGCK